MWPILHFYLQFKLLHTEPDGGSKGRTHVACMKILHHCVQRYSTADLLKR